MIDGEYIERYSSGGIHYHLMYVSLESHDFGGEFKEYAPTGNILRHEYILGFSQEMVVHDFIKDPLDDAGKMLLVLKYGGRMLPRSNDVN